MDETQVDRSLDSLAGFLGSLPPDRYAPTAHRYRRHARAVYLPWADTLSWLPDVDDPDLGPAVEYDMQRYNPEFAIRRFPAIPHGIRADPLVQSLVRFDLAETMWSEGFARTPLSVGVGCVLLSVRGAGDEALSTPNVLHQDGGEACFTFVHLLVRRNVVGGVNYIAPTRCVGLLPEELAPSVIESEFTLEQPLDSFAVHNSRVSHHVTTVRRGAGDAEGGRGILIVAVSPLVKQL
ncbi:MAG TPA: 2OG-Fe dioxygenase family protein [Actinomycetota bacterium]|nr:2OG-Fe dioxygenase family protein [Actinomycetota bacterium]